MARRGRRPRWVFSSTPTGFFVDIRIRAALTATGPYYSLDVGLKPFASLVSTSGAAGSSVGILGQGFTDTKEVMFRGGAAAFTVINDTYLVATVPAPRRPALSPSRRQAAR
jgi:hypothetical protein